MPDKYLNSQIIDMYFVATNYEEGGEQEGNDDRSLCRFEFFEILIRIARGKYVETKKETNLLLAFDKLLQEHVYPSVRHILPWQRWRVSTLWTNRVNDVFEINLHLIKKLYI